MSSQKTERYQLHKWEPGDDFLRAEFNENFATLDKSIRIVFGTYQGDGAKERSIDLGFTPQAVLLFTQKGYTGYIGAYEKTYGGLFALGFPLYDSIGLAWVVDGGIKVSHRNDNYNTNAQDKVYYYLAFC